MASCDGDAHAGCKIVRRRWSRAIGLLACERDGRAHWVVLRVLAETSGVRASGVVMPSSTRASVCILEGWPRENGDRGRQRRHTEFVKEEKQPLTSGNATHG